MSIFAILFVVVNQGRVQDIAEPEHAILDIIVDLGVVCGCGVAFLDSRFHYVLVSQRVIHGVQVYHIAITLWMSNLDADTAPECLSSSNIYFVGLAIEMLNAIRMEYTERQTWFVVVFLWVLLPVSLLLDPLELGVQEFGSILDGGIFFFVLHFLLVLLDQVSKYCVVDGQSLHRIKLFDQLQTHGASHSIFPEWVLNYIKNCSRQGVQKVWPQWMRIRGMRSWIS